MAGRGAAFFDLDRTLLAGASGAVFSKALRGAGIGGRSVPGEGLLFRLFNAFGENLPSMLLARQGPLIAAGHRQADVRRAAEGVAEELAAMVQPRAAELFDEHHRAGRAVVMATTTPTDLVAPLARRLGMDDVIATAYSVAGGVYTGGLDGPFVWSGGKLDAVRRWAAEHGVELSASFAYSDSVYDVPLLGAVGHPAAVNPDPRLTVVAKLRGWPVVSLAAAGVGDPLPLFNREPQRVLLDLTREELFAFCRFDISGIEHVPRRGPAILVANHRSYFDPVAITVLLARTERSVRFLGKKEVFDAPLLGPLAKALGGIRVDRGTGDSEPLRAAEDALRDGELVALMPQGTIPRGRAFFDPQLVGRWGAARLAAATRAPVIPIGLWGTERVWPRSSRLPRLLNVVDPPTVQIRVGEPVRLAHRSLDADTKRIMAAIAELLPDEARRLRGATASELREAMPPGWSGDVATLVSDHEALRRPGAD